MDEIKGQIRFIGPRIFNGKGKPALLIDKAVIDVLGICFWEFPELTCLEKAE